MDVTEDIECDDAFELEIISSDLNRLDMANSNDLYPTTTINIDILEEIPITIEESNMINSIDIFKSTLMSTIDKLYTSIDFLHKEIEERNLLIRTLFIKDINGVRQMDDDLLNSSSNILRDLIKTTPSILAVNNDINNVISPRDNDAQGTRKDSLNESANISLETSEIAIINDCHVQDDNNNHEYNNSNFISEHESSVCSINSNSEILIEAVIPSVLLKKSIEVQTEEYRHLSHTNYLKHLNNKKTCTINEIQQGQSHLIDRGLNKGFISGIQINNSKYPSSNNYINNIDIYEKEININAKWKPKTTLIIGDSMLNGLDEKRLINCKVRPFPGASIEDMHFHIIPLLRKMPSTIIMHVGCNNCVDDDSTQIMKKLTSLKEFILSQLDCKLIFSSIINRNDNAKAQFTDNLTSKYLSELGVQIIDNNNITIKHLGRKGHHMNPRGTGQLAINFIQVLKSL